MPIVLVDQPGGDYWKDWVTYVRKHLLDTSHFAGGHVALHGGQRSAG